MTSVAVGLSRDLPPKRVMRAQVSGQDMVVWRSSAGIIAAWDNRCPHRGMRLSHGFVRGEDLACLYHGWHFGAEGGCRYIPAHPELTPPATICTQIFSVVEAQGVIWVSADGVAEAPDLPEGLAPLRRLSVAAPVAAVEAALAQTPFAGALPQRAGPLLQLGPHRLVALTQAITAEETGLTILSDATDPADQRALSRWCEALRREAEAQEVPA